MLRIIFFGIFLCSKFVFLPKKCLQASWPSRQLVPSWVHREAHVNAARVAGKDVAVARISVGPGRIFGLWMFFYPKVVCKKNMGRKVYKVLKGLLS